MVSEGTRVCRRGSRGRTKKKERRRSKCRRPSEDVHKKRNHRGGEEGRAEVEVVAAVSAGRNSKIIR